MPLRITFGHRAHKLQTYLPGTDLDLLPNTGGLAAPDPNALSSQPFTPAGDGTETLFGGLVTATTSGFGTPESRTVLDVVGAWNSVKNVSVTAEEAARLAFLGFVHVDVIVGLGSEAGSTLELVGAKRGNVVTGAGADLVDIQIATNERTWSNTFRIATGAGDDTVRLAPLDVAAAVAAGDATFASTGGVKLLRDYDGAFARAYADLGDGADNFIVTGLIRAKVEGGEGDDQITGGQDMDTLSGGAGADTLLAGAGNAHSTLSDQLDGGEGDDLLIGDSGRDVLIGGEGDDELIGGRAADTLTGGAGADTLLGGAGDGLLDGTDVLEGGAGDDWLDGGRGGDTAVYAGQAADFEIIRAEDGRVTVRDLDPTDGEEGTDTLVNVERLRFADHTIDLRDPTGARAILSASPFINIPQLWVSDGTAEGTWALTDINPADYDSDSGGAGLTSLGDGRVLFAPSSGLWVTDGTSDGTRLVKDTNLGTGSGLVSGLVALGDGHALYGATYSSGTVALGLWATDGTTDGTYLVKTFDKLPGTLPRLAFLALDDDRALFAVDDGTHGRELWVSDGTAAGTGLVKDIYPGRGSSGDFGQYSAAPGIVALGDGRALFAANDGLHGSELWVSDGTAAGTYMVADVNPGSSWSSPRDFVALGDGRALFLASGTNSTIGLWVSDGSAAGTSMIADIDPNIDQSRWPRDFVALGDGRALFLADDSVYGSELWVSDGTAAGTHMVADIHSGSGWSSPRSIVMFSEGRALFTADDGVHGAELWVSDGTAAGTHMVADINPGPGSGYPTQLIVLADGRVLFNAYNGTDTSEPWLWVTDGTAEGTTLLADITIRSGAVLDPLG